MAGALGKARAESLSRPESRRCHLSFGTPPGLCRGADHLTMRCRVMLAYLLFGRMRCCARVG